MQKTIKSSEDELEIIDIGKARERSLSNRLESQLQLRSIGPQAKDPDHQARIAASNVKYRRGKAKEPEQQARIAAVNCQIPAGKVQGA